METSFLWKRTVSHCRPRSILSTAEGLACRWMAAMRSRQALRLPVAARNQQRQHAQRGRCVCRQHNGSEGPKTTHQVTPIHVDEHSFYEIRSHGDLQHCDLTIMPQVQLNSMPSRSSASLIVEREDLLIHSLRENHARQLQPASSHSLYIRSNCEGPHPWPSKLPRRSEAIPAMQRCWSGWRRLPSHELHPCSPSARDS